MEVRLPKSYMNIPQSEKDDENGWYKAWSTYGYYYSKQWSR